MRRRLMKWLLFVLTCFFCSGYVYAEGTNEQEKMFKEQDNNMVLNDSLVYEEVNDIESEIEFQIQKLNSPEKYALRISNSDNLSEITGFQFAVWSEENGQDDLKWYSAFEEEGYFYYNLSLTQHRGLGKYNVHVYAVTEVGLTRIKRATFNVEYPMLSDISVDKVDEEKGIFRVYAQKIQNQEYVNAVYFAVWSEENGQDDIIWYNVLPDDNGTYSKEIDIKSHGYSLGRYKVHVYVTDITGCMHYMGKVESEVNIQNGNLSVKKEEKRYTYTIELKDVAVPGGIESVMFPTWSQVEGQDDICWYSAEKKEDGSYRTTISLEDHKGFGEYSVHAYVRTKGGKLICVGKEVFMEESPQFGEMSIENYNKEKGTFQVVISDIKNEDLIRAIHIPIWSREGGQDDIVWYQAKKKDNKYVVDVDIKDHKYSMGEYVAHVYITDITGFLYFVDSVRHTVSIEPGEMTITQGKLNKTQYIIDLKNIYVPGGISEVLFPIWSEAGGQDDICWYKATRLLDGTYQLKMGIEDHRGLGVYHVHAYVMSPNGSLNLIGKDIFETKVPKIDKVAISNVDKKSGEFQVKVTGIQNDELIQKIQIPIWSENNQGDIVWYTAKRNLEGDYVVNVNVSSHKYNAGMYNVHAYLTDVTGDMLFVGKTECDMRAEYVDFSATDIDGRENTYKITLSGLEVPAGEKSVAFAVWGNESGQNDIKWYSAQKEADGVYGLTVSIRNHRELGSYCVHSYYTTKGNALSYVGATSFAVEKKPQTASALATDVDGTKGSFKVTVTGVTAPSGVEKVQIPVWCAADQSDIKWYDAVKTAEGIYSADVKVSNHGHHFGDYKIHVYVTMGNGIMVCTNRTNAYIEPKNYVYNTSLDSFRREIVILGVCGNRVQFPTWSEANGQDDIVWYEGVNCGNGKWNVVVDSAKHNSAGNYITHVYVTGSEGAKYVGATSYSLSKVPTAQSQMFARANLYGSSTPYLILVNRSTHKVGVFQGWQGNWKCVQYWDCADGAPSTPTVEGTFRVGIRGYYFDSGASRCYWYTQFRGNYLFHSVLYNKNGTLRDGRVGMPLSHGCVRLQIQNAKWIYDTIPAGTTVVVYH